MYLCCHAWFQYDIILRVLTKELCRLVASVRGGITPKHGCCARSRHLHSRQRNGTAAYASALLCKTKPPVKVNVRLWTLHFWRSWSRNSHSLLQHCRGEVETCSTGMGRAGGVSDLLRSHGKVCWHWCVIPVQTLPAPWPEWLYNHTNIVRNVPSVGRTSIIVMTHQLYKSHCEVLKVLFYSFSLI